MLFMSDYDGSLDRYLLDFMGVGSRAVIPIASSVAGCPKTRWLFGKNDPAITWEKADKVEALKKAANRSKSFSRSRRPTG